MSHHHDTTTIPRTAVKPWGGWGQTATTARRQVPIRPRPAIEAWFPTDPQLQLFDPGPIEFFEPDADDPELYRLRADVAAAWNERWAGRKVRVLTPDSGITEGFCGGVGPGLLGPSASINTSPGSSLHIDPRAIVRIVEIEHFPGDDAWCEED